MSLNEFSIVALALLAFALVSRRIEDTVLTPPMVFAGLGVLLGSMGLGVLDLAVDEGTVHTIVEITLVLVLFTDAARIKLSEIREFHNLPQRMLLIGMPLTVLLGSVAALLLFPDFGIWEAALLAAVLAPTDAALGQAVVTREEIPIRIRQTINVESGLNDGIALPVVIFFMSLTGAGMGGGEINWLAFAAQQIGLGALLGIGMGYAGGRLVDWSAISGWMTKPFQGISALGLAFLAYALADRVGGNGFIAAFVAGMVVGNVVRHLCDFLFEFAEAEGQLLTLFTFLVFGVSMVPEIAGQVTWQMLVYAVLSLTVIRMVPIALSLAGARLRLPSVLILGWFGPRGLASILFALLVVGDETIGPRHEIMMTTILTVLLSIVLHGVSAVPAARAYVRYIARTGPDQMVPEHKDVSVMPLRIRRYR